jgi:hypothetical protein
VVADDEEGDLLPAVLDPTSLALARPGNPCGRGWKAAVFGESLTSARSESFGDQPRHGGRITIGIVVDRPDAPLGSEGEATVSF